MLFKDRNVVNWLGEFGSLLNIFKDVFSELVKIALADFGLPKGDQPL